MEFKFTNLEVQKRKRTEHQIRNVLDQLKEEEIYDCVKKFMEDNTEYLDGNNLSIKIVESLIEDIRKIESNYENYRKKLTYFSIQCEEFDRKRIEELDKENEKLRKQMGDIFGKSFSPFEI